MQARNWMVGSLVVLFAGFVSSARADHLSALRQDAALLDRQAHTLCDEVGNNLRGAYNFHAIRAQVEALESRVHLFQEIAARPVNRQQLDAQLHVIDNLVVTVQDSVFRAAQGGGWGNHHHHFGVHHQHVRVQGALALLEALDNTVHHMHEHIDALQDCDFHGVQRPIYQVPAQRPVIVDPSWNQPVLPSPGYNGRPANGWNNWNNHSQPVPGNALNRGGSTIRLGNSGISISLGR